jgi:hypothetical protein
LYEDGGSALRGVSGNFPGKASSSKVVSTFLIRYWLVVCNKLTLSTKEKEQSYQNAVACWCLKVTKPIKFRIVYFTMGGKKLKYFIVH